MAPTEKLMILKQYLYSTSANAKVYQPIVQTKAPHPNLEDEYVNGEPPLNRLNKISSVILRLLSCSYRTDK